MSEIIPFDFEGAAVRTVKVDGEAWFVGKDVAERLGYADPTTAIRSHCRGVQKLHPIPDALGRVQEARILSEPDVLRLIVGSKLPSAERFEKWVFEEVLPAIRKTGSYGANDPITMLNDPAAMRGLLLTYTEKVLALEAANAELTPKADALDRIATADGSLNMTEAAKALQVRPIDLRDYLARHGWIYRRAGNANWLGYQAQVLSGSLEHKVTTVLRPDGSEKITEQVRITPKGLTKLAKLLPGAIQGVVPGGRAA